MICIRGIQSRRFDPIERTTAKIPRGTSITPRHASPRFYLQRLHSGRVFYPALVSGNRVSKITRSQLSVVSRGQSSRRSSQPPPCEPAKITRWKEFGNSERTGRVPGSSRNSEGIEAKFTGIAVVQRWTIRQILNGVRSLKVPGVEEVEEIKKTTSLGVAGNWKASRTRRNLENLWISSAWPVPKLGIIPKVENQRHC